MQIYRHFMYKIGKFYKLLISNLFALQGVMAALKITVGVAKFVCQTFSAIRVIVQLLIIW